MLFNTNLKRKITDKTPKKIKICKGTSNDFFMYCLVSIKFLVSEREYFIKSYVKILSCGGGHNGFLIDKKTTKLLTFIPTKE